jgi:hypothetical protein
VTDGKELEAWLDGNAALLDIFVEREWRAAVLFHLRLTRGMAQQVMDFPLPDDAEPAPVFRA